MSTIHQRNWEPRRAGRSVSDQSRTSYYGLPVIHKPHWKWLIVFYFFFGGISGASYIIASIAQLFGGREGRRITRAGRYISFAALLPSPILLILDLGRPERFHHMLRILKLRSPMSVGSWVLTFFSAFCMLSTAIQAAEDGLLRRMRLVNRLVLRLPSNGISVLGTVFGFALSGYTGILLAITAVPLWAKNYLLLGPLFLASAMSNATAGITLWLSLTRGASHQTLKKLERLELISLLSELGLILITRANSGPVIGRPLNEGRTGTLQRWGVQGLGIAAPLALTAIGVFGTASRRLAAISSLLTLTGGFIFRYIWVVAGRDSADDPQATFEFTRHPQMSEQHTGQQQAADSARSNGHQKSVGAR